MKKNATWHFDAKAGREEILARRIGRNEWSAIQVCLAYTDAQREYARKDWDTDGLLEYAQRIRSDAGKKNGLYVFPECLALWAPVEDPAPRGSVPWLCLESLKEIAVAKP